MSRGRAAALVAALGLAASAWAGYVVPPRWTISAARVDSLPETSSVPAVEVQESALWPLRGTTATNAPPASSEFVRSESGWWRLDAKKHWGAWSLLPAATAILLCFFLREPVAALAAGLASGALLTARYDLTGQVLIPAIGTPSGATILVLYLWLLGGLLGVWRASGAAWAFAEATARYAARGPRSAKLAAWLLGIAIFQGGTLSTVLVGSAVRPLAERRRVSREELSYIVDSTASPVAVLLPFNAWPVYVQSLILVAGVPFLVSAEERISFFFRCIPLYFYPMLAVLFTLLAALDVFPPFGHGLRQAARRARETGALDAPQAKPMLDPELEKPSMREGHALDFVLPLASIMGIAIGTFFATGTPQVLWAFGAALLAASAAALARGMRFEELMQGFQSGLRGVVYGSVVLLLAMAVGQISRETGAGDFLLSMLPPDFFLPALPVALGLATMLIAFSTGTSWGTFAVALPVAMPLAWGAAQAANLANPGLFLCVAFAAVINGSLFGDQCSPISDTTVLSSLATGCDLMDHVRTQIGPCLFAATLTLAGLAAVAAFC